MFCIKCGRPAVAENFCEKCFLESRHLFDVGSFETEFCKQCGNFHRGPIEGQIRNTIKSDNKLTSCDVKTRRIGNKIIAAVTCSGCIQQLKKAVTEERKSIAIIKTRKCENCIKISGGYYEAVLQVRGEQIDRIMNKIKYVVPNESIASISRLKEGYDIKIIDKKLGEKISSMLSEKFTINKSYKLVGEQKGKRLYRNFYAIR